MAANAGLAPELYCVQDVSGLKMIVMELLKNSHPWSSTHTKDTDLCDQLRKFLITFDNSDLVHGDLRSPNIHVFNNRVYVVDFDWVGTHNSDMT